MEVMPVLSLQVMTATRTDPILRQVLRYTRTGWPDQVSESIHSYWLKREGKPSGALSNPVLIDK